ncbi:pantetheine-phosphate adenylyltransferase [Erysipelotrichaceae bacterium]|uniref:pantetheine-phosphate adenylyltransferase n=1 Tax=unclassified Bulleidia TaxID=2704656 RepID=UPI0015B43795|nr:pantetheine-phosphate adenylyltransferase [Erysipelotrichaceae bacterium]MDD7058788.1 pantetheine-phosphate adenylyltransferase [Erysipelotrichaceae bacterium]
MKAVYPGTFDPLTNGHLDIIERAANIFDEVVVLINQNPRKQNLFTVEERVEMIQKSINTLKNASKISVMSGKGLTVNIAEGIGAKTMIRGIRAVSDYEYELATATANMKINPSIETFFLIARPEYTFLSSSTVKEIAMNDGDIRDFVPSPILEDVLKRLKQNQSM